MLPVVAFIIPLFFIAFKLNMIDTYLPIILSHLIICLPFAVWMMRGFFIELPVAIEEAARDLGSNPIRVLRTVTFPIILPSIIVFDPMILISFFDHALAYFDIANI